MATRTVADTDDLRYLAAGNVRCAAGSLAGFRVCTEDAQPIGLINGVLIKPAERRVAYFVIDSPGWFVHKRYLLALDAGAVIQEIPKTLQIPARRDELDLQAFTPSSVAEFSDDDLLRTLFPA